MKDNGILPRISFNDGAPHTVKLVKDKVDKIPDGKGGTVDGMKFMVEEGGESKTFFTGSVGLISKLASVEEGTTVTIQMKKANNKSYFVVTTADGNEVKSEDEGEIVADDETVSSKTSW